MSNIGPKDSPKDPSFSTWVFRTGVSVERYFGICHEPALRDVSRNCMRLLVVYADGLLGRTQAAIPQGSSPLEIQGAVFLCPRAGKPVLLFTDWFAPILWDMGFT